MVAARSQPARGKSGLPDVRDHHLDLLEQPLHVVVSFDDGLAFSGLIWASVVVSMYAMGPSTSNSWVRI
jgi:hypothetical protein